MATRRRGSRSALSVSLRYPSSFDVDPVARAAFIGRLIAAVGDGKDTTIVAPTVGGKDGRAKVVASLRFHGVSAKITAVLGWATSMDTEAAAPSAATKPVPIEEPTTLDDDDYSA